MGLFEFGLAADPSLKFQYFFESSEMLLHIDDYVTLDFLKNKNFYRSN
jgi:hypothetical protein